MEKLRQLEPLREADDRQILKISCSRSKPRYKDSQFLREVFDTFKFATLEKVKDFKVCGLYNFLVKFPILSVKHLPDALHPIRLIGFLAQQRALPVEKRLLQLRLEKQSTATANRTHQKKSFNNILLSKVNSICTFLEVNF